MLDPPEVYCTFKLTKLYRLPSQTNFCPIRHLPQYMLDILPSDSTYKLKHLEISEQVDLLDPSQIFDAQPSLGETQAKKGVCIKLKYKKRRAYSLLNLRPKRDPKLVNPLKMIHRSDSDLTLGQSKPTYHSSNSPIKA